MKGDKEKEQRVKGTEVHAFALGDPVGRLEGMCVFFLFHPMYCELPEGRLFGCSTFPELIQ